MAQHIATLPATQDTYVRYAYPSTNFGGSLSIVLSYDTQKIDENTTQFNRYVGLLSFGGTENKQCIGMQLKLFTEQSKTITITVAPLPTNLGDFEYTATWNTRPLGITYNSTTLTLTQGANTIDLYALFEGNEAKIKNALNNGIAIREYSLSSATFRSRESGAATAPRLLVTYADGAPYTPIASSPVNQAVTVDREIVLSWQYRPAFQIPQGKYLVQWRAQGETNWNDIIESTEQNICRIPANTFPAGNIEWRVKTYNNLNEESSFSESVIFYAVGKPESPTVYVNPSACPTIIWESKEQQLWQARIIKRGETIYKTQEMPAVTNRHDVADFLQDGEYTAGVRVRNQYGFWSDWGGAVFEVATTKPLPPELVIAANNDYGITITVGYDAPKCLLYRREIGGDYVLIGEIADTYTDYNVASGVRYEYKARAVNEDNSFADSAPKTGSVALPCSVISLGSVILPLRNRLDTGWGRDYNRTHLRVLSQFVGRAYPVVESEGFKTQTLSLNYFITPAELDIMQALIEAPVILYRNDMGDMFSGTIGNIGYNERLKGSYRGYDVTFDIQRVGDG